jgi:hypothetical protein
MSTLNRTQNAGIIITLFMAMVCLSWQKPVVNVLVNTKWKGTLFVPGAVEGMFNFGKDTVSINLGDQVLETMSYQTKGDTVFLKKLSGGSPCNDEIGQYKYVIKQNVLTFSVIKDDCDARPPSFSPDGYVKQ